MHTAASMSRMDKHDAAQPEAHRIPDGGKARRVYLILRDAIQNGRHMPGDALPGELALAESHGVSRVTIRRALDALAADKLIERRPGSGTLVRAPSRQSAEIRVDFAELMPQIVRMGKETEARLLSFSYGNPPTPVIEALKLTDNTQVQRAVRLRLIDGQPFSHLTTHVPEHIAKRFSEADLATTALFHLLERGGVRVEHARQSISAVLATPEVAEVLSVSVGAALISLTRAVFDDAGHGVEHLAALYRPDRFRLEMALERVGDGAERHWEMVDGPARQAGAA